MLVALPEARVVVAEQCLIEAIALAKKQEAKFWELRAAVALAGLWTKQDDASMRATFLLRSMAGSPRVWTRLT